MRLLLVFIHYVAADGYTSSPKRHILLRKVHKSFRWGISFRLVGIIVVCLFGDYHFICLVQHIWYSIFSHFST